MHRFNPRYQHSRFHHLPPPLPPVVTVHTDEADSAGEIVHESDSDGIPYVTVPATDPNTIALQAPAFDKLNASATAAMYSEGLLGVNQAQNWLFIYSLVASLIGILILTVVYRWLHMANLHLRRLLAMDSNSDQRYWMYNRSLSWPRLKRHLLFAPLFRHRHNDEIRITRSVGLCTLPSRYHTLLLSLFLASNMAYILVLDYSDTETAAILSDLRGRSGSLAVLNLIPTVLFALRNNPLIPLLGVSYDSFNLLHRWTARVAVLEAAIHTVAWAANVMTAGGLRNVYHVLATDTGFLWGMVATCVFGLVVIVSAAPIRHAFYETFLNGHRVMIAVGLAGVYVHLDLANLPQVPYIQICFALWVGEWIVRSWRIWYYNVTFRGGVTRVTVEALPAEACRVTFELRRPWRWQPGCHVHAYLPAFSWLSSHPFSVAWAEDRSPEPLMLGVEADEKIPNRRAAAFYNPSFPTKKLPLLPHSTNQLALPRPATATSVSLVCRARNGLTRRLYDAASAKPNRTLTTWGALEGPYGGNEAFSAYGTVVVFAGGVGITHALGHAWQLVRQANARTAATRRVLLVWSVPTVESLGWVRPWLDALLRLDGRRDILRLQIFVTKPKHRGDVLISQTGGVRMFPGRCDAKTILENEMRERVGAMAVSVCGPGAFADSVRAAVRQVVEIGVVDFVEEAFTY